MQQKQEYDRILFSKLRALRKQIAERDDVAPFVVFSDASLIEMSQQMPQTTSEFLAISECLRLRPGEMRGAERDGQAGMA